VGKRQRRRPGVQLASVPDQATPHWLRREESLKLYVTDDNNPDKADYSYRVEYILCRELDDCNLSM
jgi:hypothetical protein